ncbi:HlyD family type I secretion periplasmic adaptor subunit, partial [Magnetococcales bacterium HHB-1]
DEKPVDESQKETSDSDKAQDDKPVDESQKETSDSDKAQDDKPVDESKKETSDSDKAQDDKKGAPDPDKAEENKKEDEPSEEKKEGVDSSDVPKPEEEKQVWPPEEKEIKIKRGGRQHRFLAQSVVLEEAGLSILIRGASLLISAVIIAFFLWASYSVVEEVSPSTGEVIPSSATQSVQHLEGGIIKETLVKSGQVVEKGQLLIRLDPSSVLPELRQLVTRRTALKIQKERITAFLDDRSPDFSWAPPELSNLVAGQIQLLLAQRESRDSEKKTFLYQIQQREERIGNITRQQAALSKQLAIYSEELKMKNRGLEKGIISRFEVMGSQREESRLQSELVRLDGDLARTTKELEETQSRLTSLEDSLKKEALNELTAVQTELSQIQESVVRFTERVKRLNVVSPVRGMVKEIMVKTKNGVVSPGGVLAEIVPVDPTRIVEIRINTRDIGHIRLGQPVMVKVLTYDFARYGGIQGKLINISPSTFMDEKGEPYYSGKVELSQSYVGNTPHENEVLPGMTVQADIQTGAKTLMEYFLKPIYSSMATSFRER